MTVQRTASAQSRFKQVGMVLLGVALAAIVALSPVRSWLASIPHFWEVFYPALTVAAVALLVDAVRPPSSGLEIVTWGLFLLSAVSATVHAFWGGLIFFKIARWGAVGFIVAQFLNAFFGYDDGAEG
ncbi:MAG TPA: hypothetical protein ENL34_00565 [Chloroflexi bacterium]|nr:hypothetical protein [Chloroflexota bacterium]